MRGTIMGSSTPTCVLDRGTLWLQPFRAQLIISVINNASLAVFIKGVHEDSRVMNYGRREARLLFFYSGYDE